MAKAPAYLNKIKMTGQGVSKNIVDRAMWRDAPAPDDIWVNALARLDEHGEKAPLMDLLNSNLEIPETARHYLADLIARGVAKPKNRPRIPAYRLTDVEAVLLVADALVIECVKERGLTVKEALVEAVKQWGSNGIISVETLGNYHAGKRGHAARRAKRK